MSQSRYSLTEKEIDEIATLAAKKAVEGYCEQEKKAIKRKENEYLRITKNKLKAFRRVKASLAETESFSDGEKIEYRWLFIKDLMGSAADAVGRADDRIRSVEIKRRKDSFEVQIIERALNLYKNEVESIGSEEDKRRYRELYDLYVSEYPKNISEIAADENVSEKIVYRDIGIAVKALSVYLLGM